MSNHKAERCLFIRHTAIFSFWLLWIAQSLLSPLVAAQQVQASNEVDLGIIVTATAAGAEEVRIQLNAGTDFGVLAKEKSIDPTSNVGGISES